METQAPRTAHPLLIIAAGAVTLFSLVGIGAMLGWIPTSVGNPGGASVAQAPAQPEVQPESVKQPEHKSIPHPKPKHIAQAVPQAAAVPPPPPAQLAAVCKECAVIEDVREVEKAGDASGAGAVGGAVVGGVLGHQVGAGRGRDVATVLGAIGGGIAGHQIEKTVKKTKEYQVWVRYEDGTKGMFVQPTPPGWHVGDKVKVVNGQIQSNG